MSDDEEEAFLAWLRRINDQITVALVGVLDVEAGLEQVQAEYARRCASGEWPDALSEPSKEQQ